MSKSEIVHLDAHCESILAEYRENLPRFREMEKSAHQQLVRTFQEAGLLVAAVESRVKTESSLVGKLELKGSKYQTLGDITDILGLRVITFYLEDVDKVASAVERLFTIDWENSVDKRKLHEIDSFGYVSLHYICSVPDFPYRFEIQMRTLLQHAWSNMNHDTGYKSGVEIPRRCLRSLSRMAGILELVDEEFSQIRNELAEYRRQVQTLVASGNLDEVPLDGDSFRSYLELKPFDTLNARIASINQAEIMPVSLMQYLAVFKALGCETLGDVSRMVKEYSDAAFQIAAYQIGLTDLDIIASSLGPQDLCIAWILKAGLGKGGIVRLLDELNGPSPANDSLADFLVEQAQDLPFMNQT